jgi:hypothetical protein
VQQSTGYFYKTLYSSAVIVKRFLARVQPMTLFVKEPPRPVSVFTDFRQEFEDASSKN